MEERRARMGLMWQKHLRAITSLRNLSMMCIGKQAKLNVSNTLRLVLPSRIVSAEVNYL